MMRSRPSVTAGVLGAAGAILLTCWIAFPTEGNLELAAPLQAWADPDPLTERGPYTKDLPRLTRAFESQTYRSFCGPASLTTVLRAYGADSADQTEIFPSFGAKLDTFFTGMSLAELAALAESRGLRTEIIYADELG